jgi:four helix bundle protein
MNKGYKKLILYKKSRLLVLHTYRLTSKFPKTEWFTLLPQMRRAAISVMANIVEGYSKESSAEYVRFLTISIGSISELEAYIDLALDLKYLTEKEHSFLIDLLYEAKKLLYTSRRTIRQKR